LKSAIRNYALLFFAAVLFHVIGTWSLPLIDRDEPRFAEASREMIERENYVVPYFNNQYRFDKPPLTYWAQVASYRVFGDNDFAARFPTTIAAALVALVIFAWGTRLRSPRRPPASQAHVGGNRLAWWAAIIFTLSLQVFAHGKAAVADMWLVLFVTMAHWAGYELIAEKRTLNAQRPTLNAQWRWWWIFYVSIALAFLAKGPIAFIPFLTVAAMKFFDRSLQLKRRFAFMSGIALTLVIISLWAVPALIQTHGEFWRVGIGRHVIGRSFGAMEGHGSNSFVAYLLLFPFYFVTVFVSFFPWSIKLPGLMRKLWRDRKAAISDRGYNAEPIDLFLLAGLAITFASFTLVKTKLPHYTLPAFPLLALLLARQLVVSEFWVRRFQAIATSVAMAYVSIALIAPPLVASAFPARELFQQSQNDLRPEMEFGAVDFTEPSLVWYFRSRVRGWMTTLDRDTVKPFMEKPGPRFAILPAKLAETLFADHPTDWKTYSHRGFNLVKGKQVDLTLILKPE
jgi:4-amino-4-deoxy-L-arabinose transferase-like glycosyltransferase